MSKLLVLDTSAIIAGFVPNLSDAEQFTVTEVLEEAKSLSTKLGLETAVISGKLKILKPSKKAMDEVAKMVKTTGDSVSETDVKLLALAVDHRQKGVEIITDDYAIQNLASMLGVEHRSGQTLGIRKVFEWKSTCPACGRKYPAEVTECQVCGSTLKRRPKKF